MKKIHVDHTMEVKSSIRQNAGLTKYYTILFTNTLSHTYILDKSVILSEN